jgi:hypothetical protein
MKALTYFLYTIIERDFKISRKIVLNNKKKTYNIKRQFKINNPAKIRQG